jgi:hypothetical protein
MGKALNRSGVFRKRYNNGFGFIMITDLPLAEDANTANL